MILQVRNVELPDRSDLRKLQKLKDELGELSYADERRYNTLLRAVEKEILQAADVVCCTCVGAGDPRISGFRFRKVGWLSFMGPESCGSSSCWVAGFQVTSGALVASKAA